MTDIYCTATVEHLGTTHTCNQPSRHKHPHICGDCGMSWPWVSGTSPTGWDMPS